MLFITGGAFNGKKNWVLKQYQDKIENNCLWHSCYKQKWNNTVGTSSYMTIVIEGIEHDLKNDMKTDEDITADLYFQKKVQPLITWEQERTERRLIIIGTDITKGIVPVKAEDRKTRDETGRLYQMFIQLAEEKFIIWFGIAKSL